MELTEEEKAVMRKVAANAARVRTPTTAAAARANGAKSEGRPKGTGKPMSEETKAKMRASQQARRERQRAAKEGTAE